MEKKKRAEDRHKQKFLGVSPTQQIVDEPEDVVTIISRDLQMAKI